MGCDWKEQANFRDRMFDDFNELLIHLQRARIKCLVVGGYAVSLNAQPCATEDIDLLIKPDADNAKAV
ncbi:MAG TPA: hypothetical protein VIX19_06165 [Terriglobales bacterium]